MAEGLGELVGGFLNAFSQTKMAGDQAAQNKKENKLKAQLFEMQLEKIQKQNEALSRTGARMQPGGFDIPGRIAEFVPGAPRATPGGRAIPNFQQQGASLPELLSDPQALSDLIQSGQVNAGQLMGSQGAPPKALQMLQAAGIDPRSEEGRAAILNSVGGDTDTDKLLAVITANIQKEKLDEKRAEREKNERTEEQRIAGTKVAIRKDFSNANEILQLQTELEGTALQAGVPYSEMVRNIQAGGAALAAAMGFDVSKSRAIIEKYDRLTKLFADGTIESLDRFAGTGSITNAKFKALTQATPGIHNSPGANALLIADNLQAALDAADIEKIVVDGREEIEAFIKSAKGFIDSPGEAGSTVLDAASETAGRVIDGATDLGGAAIDAARERLPGALATAESAARKSADVIRDKGGKLAASAKEIAKMTISDIQEIDTTALAEWTDEQRAALEKRLEELGF